MEPSNTKKSKQDRIEEIKKSLYAKDFSDTKIVEPIPGKQYDVPQEWNREEPKPPRATITPPKKNSLLAKMLIGAIVFFVLAGGFAVWRILSGSTFSANNVQINISGPIAVAAGDPLNLQVSIANNNETPIENAQLYIEYPTGAYETADATKALIRSQKEVGDVRSFETVNDEAQFVLFGEKEEKKEIKFVLEFRFQGSSATLSREETYSVDISSSPLDVNLSLHQEIVIGQEEQVSVVVRSNSSKVLKDLVLAVDYPSGFQFGSATPAPTSNNDIWVIGDLQPGAERSFLIKGVFNGKDGEDKLITTSVGRRGDAGDRPGAVYVAVSESTALRNASLALNLLFNGVEKNEYISTSGERVRVDVAWKNTLPVKIQNAEISLKLEGDSLDRFSVTVGKTGFYRSVDNTVVWNQQTLESLGSIEPGASGLVSFTLESKQSADGVPPQNPSIDLSVVATGRSVDPDGTPKPITVTLGTRKIELQTTVSLAGQTLYYTGPFLNNGPIPPRAEQRTTYTVLWTVTNSSSDVRNGKVTATLPVYAEWLGTSGSGFTENISFNPVGGQVVWDLGDVKAGTGFVRPARQAAFQVAFTPSISQIDSVPELTSDIIFIGEDLFTKAQISKAIRAVTTRLTGDPQALPNTERVMP